MDGPEKWLNKKHWFFLQKTIWQFTNVCNSSPRAQLWPPQVLHPCDAQTHMHPKHRKKIIHFLNNYEQITENITNNNIILPPPSIIFPFFLLCFLLFFLLDIFETESLTM